MYKSWIWAVLIAFDQLGNALCGGHPDNTVSARLWHLDDRHSRPWFRLIRRAVDFAFRPADGAGHCREAWQWEQLGIVDPDYLEQRMRRGNDVALIALTWLVLVFVPILFLVNCLRWLAGRFRSWV